MKSLIFVNCNTLGFGITCKLVLVTFVNENIQSHKKKVNINGFHFPFWLRTMVRPEENCIPFGIWEYNTNNNLQGDDSHLQTICKKRLKIPATDWISLSCWAIHLISSFDVGYLSRKLWRKNLFFRATNMWALHVFQCRFYLEKKIRKWFYWKWFLVIRTNAPKQFRNEMFLSKSFLI